MAAWAASTEVVNPKDRSIRSTSLSIVCEYEFEFEFEFELVFEFGFDSIGVEILDKEIYCRINVEKFR